MTHLVAIAVITRTPAGSPPTKLIGYDENGGPIIRAIAEHVQPGAIFEEGNPIEFQWLLDQGAARIPTKAEMELWERSGPNT